MSEEGTLRWFGHRYNAPAWDDMPKSDEDVIGSDCIMCGDPITADDDGLTIPDGMTGIRSPMHVQCFWANLGITRRPSRIE